MKNIKLTETDLLTIVAINDSIASIKDKTALFEIIFNKLEPVFKFVFAAIMLYDKSKTQLEVRSWTTYGAAPEKANWSIVPVSEIPFHISNRDITRLKVSDIGRVKFVMDEDVNSAIKAGIKEIIICPLRSSGNVIGYLTMTPTDLEALSEHKLDFLMQISNPIAAAVSNITAYEELLHREKEKELQIKFINSLVGIKNREEMCFALVSEINKTALFRFMSIIIEMKDETRKSVHNYIISQKGVPKIYSSASNLDEQISQLFAKEMPTQKLLEFNPQEIANLVERSSFLSELNKKIEIFSFVYLANNLDENKINLILINQSNDFSEQILDYLSSARGAIELAFRNLFAFEENEILRKQLEREKNLLLDEINVTGGSLEIIGSSAAIKKAYKQINQVAKTDATVLIQGETGVGKEVIAKTLHSLSNRKDRVFITVNCAALPGQLIESELFGHEKGSFTGAVEKKTGKFELANGGTIFLDEIGELPLDLQAKLLRALQEKEFERIGGKEVFHTDIRIIAATNRDLQKEITRGHFRPDLFFRLNVFPILLPPLRERPEDIPLFIKYFTEKYSKRVGVPIRYVRSGDMNILMQYHWPGNIRELEHIIERSVIISTGTYLEFTEFAFAQKTLGEESAEDFKNLRDMEREHIIAALKLTNGRISGDKGAGKLLGINGKTLDSKIKKLGIKKEIILR